MSSDCCNHNGKKPKKPSILLWTSLTIVVISYLVQLFAAAQIAAIPYLPDFTSSTFELVNRMSWGIALGVLFVGLLDRIPREFILATMGKGGSVSGILRATLAGILLDLCSHGILLVGMKLYQRGLSLGQTMAFLIASPWNSLSLTLVLWSLVGFNWMMSFLLLSMVIAIISGIIFDQLVKRKVLPANPNTLELPKDFKFFKEAKKQFQEMEVSISSPFQLLWNGIKGSKSILKWILFGIVLASLIRTFVPPEQFEALFGPTLAGLGLTVIFATILEVCSEGSTPIAADILTKAAAPGNSFAFLMTGISTDYTEILSLKETTKSWKIAFFLPLVTLPQVLAIAIIINQFTA